MFGKHLKFEEIALVSSIHASPRIRNEPFICQRRVVHSSFYITELNIRDVLTSGAVNCATAVDENTVHTAITISGGCTEGRRLTYKTSI
jgi:hypothetical protein